MSRVARGYEIAYMGPEISGFPLRLAVRFTGMLVGWMTWASMPRSLPRHAVPLLNHRFNDGCMAFIPRSADNDP